MFTQDSLAAPFPTLRMGERFMEASDVNDAAIFKCEQLCCAITLRNASFVLSGTHVPFQTLPLAREESEQTCQGGLELRHPSHIFERRWRSVRWTSAQQVLTPKCIGIPSSFEFFLRQETYSNCDSRGHLRHHGRSSVNLLLRYSRN